MRICFPSKEKHQLKCNTDDEANILTMVRSGVGLFVSYEDKSVVRLYHIESKEPLQEISIASSVERIIGENFTCYVLVQILIL